MEDLVEAKQEVFITNDLFFLIITIRSLMFYFGDFDSLIINRIKKMNKIKYIKVEKTDRKN